MNHEFFRFFLTIKINALFIVPKLLIIVILKFILYFSELIPKNEFFRYFMIIFTGNVSNLH